MNLVKICQEKLDKATKQVNKIVNENNELEDFEVAERQENHGSDTLNYEGLF